MRRNIAELILSILFFLFLSFGGQSVFGYIFFQILIIRYASRTVQTLFGVISICMLFFFFNSAHLAWLYTALHDYGEVSWIKTIAAIIALALYLALYPALTLGVYQWLLRYRQPHPFMHLLMIASLLTLAEYCGGTFFGGFSWLSSGYQMIDTPLASLASVFGLYGVSFASWVVAACIVHGLTIFKFNPLPTRPWWQIRVDLTSRGLKSSLCGMLIVGLVIIGVDNQHLFATSYSPSTDSLQIKLLQPNFNQKTREGSDFDRQYEYFIKHLRDFKGHLLVAPEMTINASFAKVYFDLFPVISAFTIQNVSNFLMSAMDVQSRSTYFNSAFLFNFQGQLTYQYKKVKLVPFGEVDLITKWFSQQIKKPFLGTTAGPQMQKSFQIQGIALQPIMCYESLFGNYLADLLLNQRDNEPQAVLVLTNLSWFGEQTSVLKHQINILRMRAIEIQKPILQSANTGISAYVLPNGQIKASLPPLTEGSLSVNLTGQNGLTPFVRYQNKPILAVIGLLLIGGLWRSKKARSDESI